MAPASVKGSFDLSHWPTKPKRQPHMNLPPLPKSNLCPCPLPSPHKTMCKFFRFVSVHCRASRVQTQETSCQRSRRYSRCPLAPPHPQHHRHRRHRIRSPRHPLLLRLGFMGTVLRPAYLPFSSRLISQTSWPHNNNSSHQHHNSIISSNSIIISSSNSSNRATRWCRHRQYPRRCSPAQ